MAVIETVEHCTRVIGGKEYQVTIIRREGLDTYYDRHGENPFQATRATFVDYGPKMGVNRSFDRVPEVEPTEEERAAGRQHIKDVALKCLIDQGIW